MTNRTAADTSNEPLSPSACARFVRDMRMFLDLKKLWSEFARYESHVGTEELDLVHAVMAMASGQVRAIERRWGFGGVRPSSRVVRRSESGRTSSRAPSVSKTDMSADPGGKDGASSKTVFVDRAAFMARYRGRPVA